MSEEGICSDLSAGNVGKRKLPPDSIRRVPPFSNPEFFAGRERKRMTNAAPPITSLVALTLPSTPDSVRKARLHTRAALDSHELGNYADDAETITSELVTNAITHAGAATFGPDACTWNALSWQSSSPTRHHVPRLSGAVRAAASTGTVWSSSTPYRQPGDGSSRPPARPSTQS